MKKIFISSIILVFSLGAYAQGVAVNENGIGADPTALLDISSTTKGMLIPRMRTIERTAIQNPAEGLLVYDIDTYTFWYCNFSVWKEILKTGDGGFALPYVGTGSDPDKLFSITNTNPANGTTIFGRRLGGSGLGLSSSNAIWGDDLNGNGVAGTSDSGSGIAGLSNTGIGVSATSISGPAILSFSTTGFGMSSTSQTNFGLGSTSFGVDKAGLLGTNGNSTGVGYGVIGLIENPTGGAGVWGKNNAVAGHAGLFTIINSNNNQPALKSLTAGTGNAAAFEITNALNVNAALSSSTIGKGKAASFYKNNTSGVPNDIHEPAVFIENISKGSALKINSLHVPNIYCAVDIDYSGGAYGLKVNSTYGGIFANSTSTTGSTIMAQNSSGGPAIVGLGNGADVPAVTGENGTTGGVGVQGKGISGIGVQGIGINVSGIGVKGICVNPSSSAGAVVGINNSAASGNGVYGSSLAPNGVGVYGYGPGTNGIGVIGHSASNVYAGVIGRNDGNGDGVHGYTLGELGSGVSGLSTSASSIGVKGTNTEGGLGVYGYSIGPNAIGIKAISNSDPGTYGVAMWGANLGEGDGLRGQAGTNGNGVTGADNPDGSGRAARFIKNGSGNNDAVLIENAGTGAALNIIATNNSNTVTMVRVTKGGSGDYIVFEEENGLNEVRFDNNGKGYFNGGTQTGGADIAESFEVSDDILNYEPGDVLMISIDKDRTVVKSNQPYSNLVAGVYATKPGVLMTEENIDADLSGQVPMGVIGVIPTKVCIEGGTIMRGDMLVTSSISGVAMKADPEKVKLGQVLGKALENYNGTGIGKIRVLVSVK